MKKHYCRICGALLKSKLVFIRYNTNTGKPIEWEYYYCKNEKWWNSHDKGHLDNLHQIGEGPCIS